MVTSLGEPVLGACGGGGGGDQAMLACRDTELLYLAGMPVILTTDRFSITGLLVQPTKTGLAGGGWHVIEGQDCSTHHQSGA